MKNVRKDAPRQLRRKSVIKRLEAQLVAGTKPEFIVRHIKGKDVKKQSAMMVDLSDTDIKRINKELEILRSRN